MGTASCKQKTANCCSEKIPDEEKSKSTEERFETVRAQRAVEDRPADLRAVDDEDLEGYADPSDGRGDPSSKLSYCEQDTDDLEKLVVVADENVQVVPAPQKWLGSSVALGFDDQQAAFLPRGHIGRNDGGITDARSIAGLQRGTLSGRYVIGIWDELLGGGHALHNVGRIRCPLVNNYVCVGSDGRRLSDSEVLQERRRSVQQALASGSHQNHFASQPPSHGAVPKHASKSCSSTVPSLDLRSLASMDRTAACGSTCTHDIVRLNGARVGKWGMPTNIASSANGVQPSGHNVGHSSMRSSDRARMVDMERRRPGNGCEHIGASEGQLCESRVPLDGRQPPGLGDACIGIKALGPDMVGEGDCGTSGSYTQGLASSQATSSECDSGPSGCGAKSSSVSRGGSSGSPSTRRRNLRHRSSMIPAERWSPIDAPSDRPWSLLPWSAEVGSILRAIYEANGGAQRLSLPALASVLKEKADGCMVPNLGARDESRVTSSVSKPTALETEKVADLVSGASGDVDISQKGGKGAKGGKNDKGKGKKGGKPGKGEPSPGKGVAAAEDKGKGKGKTQAIEEIEKPKDSLEEDELPKGKGKGKGKSGPPAKAKGAPQKGAGKGGNQPRKASVAPAIPMKKFFWTSHRIQDPSQNTIWNEIHNTGRHFDVSDLENYFPESPSRRSFKTAGDSDPTQVAEKKPIINRIQVIEDKNRRRQLHIMIKRLPGKSTMREGVLNMDTGKLNKDQVELLLSNCPPQDEALALNQAKRGATLDERNIFASEEDYMLTLLAVPRYKLRLEVWHFENTFEEHYEILELAETQVSRACDCVLKSENIRRLLGLMLFIGNYLNGGTARGQADGFAIDTLLMLKTVKMSTGGGRKGTLIDYLVQQMDREYPGAIDTMCSPGQDAELFRQAARHQLKDILAELEDLRTLGENLLTQVQGSSDPVDGDGDSSLAALHDRLVKRVTNLQELKERFNHLDAKYKELCLWFQMEDRNSKKSTEEFFGIWSTCLAEAELAAGRAGNR